MSPIIELQRRLVEVGRIRMGTTEERAKRDGSGTFRMPVRLDTWRLTSRDQTRLQHAADQFGGQVVPWDQRDGEYELITETDSLPIMVLPGQNLSSWYELWGQRSKGKPVECFRRCDGVTETISDGPCQCDPEQRECKPTTRLTVLLPDVPGIGCWRLDSHGYYAAIELAGTADLLETLTRNGQVVPARLRIDQRRAVRDGESTVFPVPVIDVDASLPEVLGLTAGSARAVIEAPGYKPVAQLPAAGVTVEEGLAGAEASGKPRSSNGREAAPIPVADVPFGDDDPVPVPVPNDDGSTSTTVTVSKPTQAQLKKLNVLVGKLRDAGSITTEHLWAALAKERNVPVDTMIELLAGRDAEGLHWSPLRDSLTKAEASGLIDRLEKLG